MSLKQDETTIQAILDGKLSPAEFEVFERRLVVEPELRGLYRSYSRMSHVLVEKFEHSGSGLVPFPGDRGQRFGAWVAAAACVLALAALTTYALRGKSEALVEFGPESRGQVIHVNGGTGLSLREGSVVQLAHGSASIGLADGSRAYLEGPGFLEYRSRQWLHLGEGRAWFDLTPDNRGLTCTTDAFKLAAHGDEFGLIADAGRRQEVHVLRGSLQLEPRDGSAAPRDLASGHAAVWSKKGLSVVESPTTFSNLFPERQVVFSEDFSENRYTQLAHKQPDAGAGPWQVERGAPVVVGGLLDTSGPHRTAAFAPLSGPPLDELSHIILLTIETENPGTSRFHSAGWAGVSLYAGNQERIFVGDPNGPAEGWALHPVGSEARSACPLLEGKNAVTLRYNYRNGLAELFEGTTTTGPPLASEWISPGLTFDRIRIANGSQADAAVDAGKAASAAGEGPEVTERGDIALRRICVTVLSADHATRRAQP